VYFDVTIEPQWHKRDQMYNDVTLS